MTSRTFAFAALAGALASACIAVAAEGLGVTNVRVGPTAAIGVATSADGLTVYVANGNGVFKSADGGLTWRRLPVD